MVKAHPPHGPALKFQGRRDYLPEPGPDDWGLTPEQQETYVELFRRHIVEVDEQLWDKDKHDYFTLRRFLRARTYDIGKATEMWVHHIRWRQENDVDDVLVNFSFPEREEFVKYFPQGYHKTDKLGRPIYVQLMGGVNMAQLKKVATEDRMFRFHIHEYERVRKVVLPLCSRLHGKQIETTFNIMDVKGMGLAQCTGDALKMFQRIAKADQDNFPEMLGHICIINAPVVFRAIWNMAKGFIDARTQGKVQILGPNYKAELLKWVDEASLMERFGGSSTGSLADDVGPWNDPQLYDKLGLDMEELKRGIVRAPIAPIDRPYEQQLAAAGPAEGAGAAAAEGPGQQPRSAAAAAEGSYLTRYTNPEYGTTSMDGTASAGASPEGKQPPPAAAAAQAPTVGLSLNRSGEASPGTPPGEAAGPLPSSPMATRSGSGAGPGPGAVGAGAGVAGGAVAAQREAQRRLVARQQELRQQLAAMRAGAAGNGTAGSSEAANVSPEPGVAEGSLIHRVQVLETSLDTVMEAQSAALHQLSTLTHMVQQQHEQQQRERKELHALYMEHLDKVVSKAGAVGSGAGGSGRGRGAEADRPAPACGCTIC